MLKVYYLNKQAPFNYSLVMNYLYCIVLFETKEIFSEAMLRLYDKEIWI